MRGETDEELVARALGGARECFSELVRRHKDRVFGMIQRQVKDETVAADLTQDTFLRSFERLKSFRGESSFGTWLIRIALNVTNNFFASAAYRRSKKSESFEVERHDASAVERGDVDRIRRAIGELKPAFRDVLVLCALEGYAYVEVAEMLSIPVGTVRSRLNTARLQLAEVLQHE